MYSLRQNAQYQVIMLGSGILGLIYVSVSYKLDLLALRSIIMALAYCWGLILAIYLMGHGLVAIPRTLIRNASISGRLRKLQSQAPKLYEKMEDSLASLEDLEVQVSELSKQKTGSARIYRDWIEELAEICNVPESRPTGVISRIGVESRILPTVITEKYLADLTRQLIRARHARSRYVDEWSHLLGYASQAQAVLDSAGSKRLDFGQANPDSSLLERFRVLTPYTRYVLHFHVLPGFKIFLGGFLALASVCIVWSELIKVLFPSLSVIRLTVVHHWTGDKGQVGFTGQVIAALWILYMCAAALISVTEVKVWRGRALVRRNTAHESAFWYASQVARLSVPLSYNFMTFLSPTVYKNTTFYAFLGKLIDLTPLGKWFDYLFPILVLVPVCATLFGFYGKVKRFFGLELELVDDEEDNVTGYGTGSWREGRDLIERELNGTSISRRRDDLASGAAGSRAAPVLSVPAARAEGARTPFATSPSSYRDGPTRGGAQPSRSAATDSELEDDGFFSNLGHRFKNTVDTIDTPKWLQEIGEGFKKPKWMGGDDEEAGSSRPAAGRSNSDVRRWFGGEGRVRL